MSVLQIGDVVTEKGKTIPMTVCRIEQDTIYCQWFIRAELKDGTFQVDKLMKSGD
ncbi:MAG: hypothetical protein ACLP5H_31040 [Desulfomonilaceae bacterium]